MQVSPDGMIILPSSESAIEVLEMNGNLSDSLAFATRTITTHGRTQPHTVYCDVLYRSPKGQISGIALQILFQPITQKTESKRVLYGDMLIELCQHVLELAGFDPDIDITIHWPATPAHPTTSRTHRQH